MVMVVRDQVGFIQLQAKRGTPISDLSGTPLGPKEFISILSYCLMNRNYNHDNRNEHTRQLYQVVSEPLVLDRCKWTPGNSYPIAKINRQHDGRSRLAFV